MRAPPGSSVSPSAISRVRSSALSSDRVVVGRKVEFEDGSVRIGEGVQIGADRKSQTLKRLEGLAVGKMPRAAKSHVFEKMRNALFRICFVEGAGCNAEPHGNLARGRCIFLDRVPHTIRQSAEQDRQIGRQIGFCPSRIRDVRCHRLGEERIRRPDCKHGRACHCRKASPYSAHYSFPSRYARMIKQSIAQDKDICRAIPILCSFLMRFNYHEPTAALAERNPRKWGQSSLSMT